MAFAFAVAAGATGAQAADEKMRDVKDRPAFTMESGQVDTKRVIGMKVTTPDGKHAGEIDQLLVNVRDGKITHAIVGLGGFAGVGERHVVVPWSQVKVQAQGDRRDLVAMIDRATLDSARRYSRDASAPAASPATAPAADRDRDGTKNKADRAPNNPNKQ